jgi:hypothetical protein
METKKQVTTKFVIGAALIAASLALGKLVLIPIVIFPGNKTWQVSMFWTYLFSWAMFLPGLYLAGKEGWLLVTHKYKEYGDKTMCKVREHGRNVTEHTARVLEHPVKVSKALTRLGRK